MKYIIVPNGISLAKNCGMHIECKSRSIDCGWYKCFEVGCPIYCMHYLGEESKLVTCSIFCWSKACSGLHFMPL